MQEGERIWWIWSRSRRDTSLEEYEVLDPSRKRSRTETKERKSDQLVE